MAWRIEGLICRKRLKHMLNERTISTVIRRLTARNDGKEYSLRVLVHPSILERLRSEDADLLVRMEKLFGVKLAFVPTSPATLKTTKS